MEINDQLASLIVERTTKVLGENINIMDKFGVIIGSADKGRIDHFHEGAAKVLSSGRALEITKEDENKLKGVKPGINLPIEFDDRIIGVVGITGNPNRIRGYAELVKITVELMLQQSLLKEQIRLEDKAHANLIQDLIAKDGIEDEELIKVRAQTLGYDLLIPRIGLVVGVDNFWKVKEANTIEEGVYTQQLRNEILKDINSFLYDDQDMVSIIGNNNYLILKTFNSSLSLTKRRDYMLSLAKKVKRILYEKKKLKITIGIGNYYPGIKGINSSFQEALKARKIGVKLLGANNFYHINDLAVGKLIEEIPQNEREWFLDITLGNNEDGLKLSEDLLETLQIFFENDLNISQAAKRLYIHRNTLLYRLDKIKEITDLDPRKFLDALRLQLALIINNYELNIK